MKLINYNLVSNFYDNRHGLFRNPKFDIKEMCGRMAVIYVLYFYVLLT
jgi:hypothetical protein